MSTSYALRSSHARFGRAHADDPLRGREAARPVGSDQLSPTGRALGLGLARPDSSEGLTAKPGGGARGSRHPYEPRRQGGSCLQLAGGASTTIRVRRPSNDRPSLRCDGRRLTGRDGRASRLVAAHRSKGRDSDGVSSVAGLTAKSVRALPRGLTHDQHVVRGSRSGCRWGTMPASSCSSVWPDPPTPCHALRKSRACQRTMGCELDEPALLLRPSSSRPPARPSSSSDDDGRSTSPSTPAHRRRESKATLACLLCATSPSAHDRPYWHPAS